MNKVFSEDQRDILCGRVRRVLKETGYEVNHDALSELLHKKNLCQSSRGRFLFNDQIIDEFAAYQKKRMQLLEISEPTPVVTSEFNVNMGNINPKYYDYSKGVQEPAVTEHLEKIVKYAHNTDEIRSIIMPLSVTDKPPLTAPISSFLTMAELTDKYGYYLEPLIPELVKYLAELSVVFLGEGEEDAFIDPCNCINPILKLENRTAGVMIERAKYNVSSNITSMPTAGGNAPVTVDGAVIQGTAEIVGGLIISWILNPDVNNRGSISSSVIDFRYANTTQSSPETVLIDCGVVELMEHGFGGNTGIGGSTFVTAKRPGLQAVSEKLLKMVGYQKYTGTLDSIGGCILDNGSLFSPEQFILDLEIQKSFFHLKPTEILDDEAVSAIEAVAETGGADFLSVDHTLSRFRNAFWDPSLFLRKDEQSESDILNKAHLIFEDTVNNYKGYEYDKEKINAGREILHRAEKELL